MVSRTSSIIGKTPPSLSGSTFLGTDPALADGAGGAGDKIGTLPPFPGSRLFAGKRVPQATAFLDRRGEGGKHSGLSAAS